MGINYDKWAKLDEFSSSDEEGESARKSTAASLRFRAQSTDESLPKGRLITIPWNTHCEAVRWALDRHGVQYVEEDYPWGAHLWATLGFSLPMPKSQQVDVPVFESGNGEIVRRSAIDVFTWLFSRSLSSPIRLYTPPSALDLQTQFDNTLAPAAQVILLNAVLGSRQLTRKYLIDPTHLNSWRVGYAVLRPVVHTVLSFRSGCRDARRVADAWGAVQMIFDTVDDQLAQQARETQIREPYLCGKTFTAADISFASHCIPILFPNPARDTFAGQIGMSVPSLDELSPDVADRVRALRATRAGKHAIRMWRRERGVSCRTWRSKYGKENNPWWANEARLGGMVYGGITVLVGVVLAVSREAGWVWGTALFSLCLIAACLGLYMSFRHTTLATRAHQLFFTRFGKVERSSIEPKSQPPISPAAPSSAPSTKPVRDASTLTPSRPIHQET
ncbi:hypothetical protein DFS34DRAFT_649038 [Phlyctochytrium arcticum]|nr:hypothetical protein DFS34DRAFT_649038 [Phlyctochytrium arcticum]